MTPFAGDLHPGNNRSLSLVQSPPDGEEAALAGGGGAGPQASSFWLSEQGG